MPKSMDEILGAPPVEEPKAEESASEIVAAEEPKTAPKAAEKPKEAKPTKAKEEPKKTKEAAPKPAPESKSAPEPKPAPELESEGEGDPSETAPAAEEGSPAPPEESDGAPVKHTEDDGGNDQKYLGPKKTPPVHAEKPMKTVAVINFRRPVTLYRTAGTRCPMGTFTGKVSLMQKTGNGFIHVRARVPGMTTTNFFIEKRTVSAEVYDALPEA